MENAKIENVNVEAACFPLFILVFLLNPATAAKVVYVARRR